jgi:hypothetical protein
MVSTTFEGVLDTSKLGSMSKSQIESSLPKNWVRGADSTNTYVSYRDANGQQRLRFDPPDKVTQYDHLHLFDDKEGRPLDKNLNIVDRKSTDAHVRYDDPNDPNNPRNKNGGSGQNGDPQFPIVVPESPMLPIIPVDPIPFFPYTGYWPIFAW